jgi:hypothetical protein
MNPMVFACSYLIRISVNNRIVELAQLGKQILVGGDFRCQLLAQERLQSIKPWTKLRILLSFSGSPYDLHMNL